MENQFAKSATTMGLNLFETIAMSAIRGALNGHIGQFTPIELQNAVDTNMNLWGETGSDIRQDIGAWKHRFRGYFDKYFNQINTELLVEWLRKDQPELHAVIMNSSINYYWFNNQVEEFLQSIREI